MSDIKILLVEDESLEVMELKRTLKFLGYELNMSQLLCRYYNLELNIII